MNTHIAKLLRQFLVAFFALAAVLLFASATSAWTAPSGSPPSGNVAAPLNVGATSQVKSGGLGVTSLAADRLCLGTNCITQWPTSGGSSSGVPNCRICVRAGLGNNVWGAESCKPFNGGVASSGAESGHAGRGAVVEVQVKCP